MHWWYLLYVAHGMVKKNEVLDILSMKSTFHNLLMVYTAIMVPFTGFLTAVVSAIIIYAVLRRFFEKKIAKEHEPKLSKELEFD